MLKRPTGNETSKFQNKINHLLKGRGIDIGCGAWPLNYSNLDTLDHALKVNPSILSKAEKIPKPKNYYDFVYSSHCLEHVKFPKKVLKEWIRVLKPGGLLILFLPHKYFYPNVRDQEGNAGHWNDFRPEDVIRILNKLALTYLLESGTIAEDVIPRWQEKISYPLKKEFNQYSFYIIAGKKNKKNKERFWLESLLNKIPKIMPALKNRAVRWGIRKEYLLNPSTLLYDLKAKLYCLAHKDKKIEISDYSIKLLTKFSEEYNCAKDRLIEFPFIEHIIKHLKNSHVVYDVGAFIGLHSMFFSQKAKEVHSFEPSKFTFNRLCANIKHNNFSNIFPFWCAVGSQNKQGSIYVKKRGLYQKTSFHQAESDNVLQEVEIRTLDQHAAFHPWPDILKIDAEGAEYEVLKGARNILENSSPLIFMELHPHICDDFEKALEFLKELGYNIERMGPRNKIFAHKNI